MADSTIRISYTDGATGNTTQSQPITMFAVSTPVPLPVPTPTPVPLPSGNVHPFVVDMLQNQRDNGWNHSKLSPGQLINWRTGTNPLQSNWNGSGHTDDTSTPPVPFRHDPLTDLRYVHNILVYKSRVPSDTQFDADLAQYLPIVKAETGSNERGWVYFLLLDMGKVSGDAYWANLAHAYADAWLKAGPIQTVPPTKPGGPPVFRSDWATQQPCALIVDGTMTGNAAMVTEGRARLAKVYADHYDTKNNIMWNNGQMKLGEVGQIGEALFYAYQATGDIDFLNKANALMLGAALAWNPGKMPDGKPVNGYFAKCDNTNGVPTPQTSKMEAGRGFEMLHLASLLGMHSLVDSLKQSLTGPAYSVKGHGVVYEVGPQWNILPIGPTVGDWVTAEAMGIAIEALNEAYK